MEKLIIFGIEHQVDVEIEIEDDSEFGMIAVIIYTNGTKEILQNLTEFHHLYNSYRTPEHASAFESDIHGTGGTKKVSHISEIVISKADKLYESYYA